MKFGPSQGANGGGAVVVQGKDVESADSSAELHVAGRKDGVEMRDVAQPDGREGLDRTRGDEELGVVTIVKEKRRSKEKAAQDALFANALLAEEQASSSQQSPPSILITPHGSTSPTPRPRRAPSARMQNPAAEVVPDSIGRETCPICIVDFEEGDDLRVLPCEGKHRFHQECVDQWLLELSSSCPICRQGAW